MKLLVLTMITAAALQLSAQGDKYKDSYICNSGKIHFFAGTPVEDVDATSNNTICVINTTTGKISAKVQMTTFQFRRKKMQDDFNEDYLESAKYPYAMLDATIAEKLDYTKDGTYDVTLKGTFEIHGVKKDREIKGKLTIKNGQPVNATATFNVELEDHNIKIPTLVVLKVSKTVKVDVDFTFVKYEKS